MLVVLRSILFSLLFPFSLLSFLLYSLNIFTLSVRLFPLNHFLLLLLYLPLYYFLFYFLYFLCHRIPAWSVKIYFLFLPQAASTLIIFAHLSLTVSFCRRLFNLSLPISARFLQIIKFLLYLRTKNSLLDISLNNNMAEEVARNFA